MADISSIGHGSVGPLNHSSTHAAHTRNGTPPQEPARSALAAGRDRVELSEHARLLDQLRQLPAIRTEKVEAVREAIADGTYETPEKLDIAVSRLLADL